MNLNIGEKSVKGEPKMREMEQIKMNQNRGTRTNKGEPKC